MNLTRKPSAQRLAFEHNEVPDDVPKLNSPWDRKDLEEYNAKIKKWWYDFRDVLERQRQEIANAFNTQKQAMEAEVAKFSNAIAETQGRVDTLETPPVADTDPLAELLAEHIANHRAHGIGLDAPIAEEVASRFTAEPSVIGSSEQHTIPADHHLVTAGPYRIYGMLTIGGYFVNLTI